MNNLYNQIKGVIDLSICDEEVSNHWLKRLGEGKLTRDENPISHFSCYFLPYNPATRKVFIVHHKKAGLWLFPGGHIDEGETLMQTLNREIEEELGIQGKIPGEIQPFLLSTTPIDNAVQPCKEHLDIWYRFPTNGLKFHVDPREFHATKWLTIGEARKIVTDAPNREALDRTEQFLKR